MNSLGPGRSPRKSIPDSTPTTGTGSDDSELTATGSVRAIVNHAQCATRAGEKDVVEHREPRRARHVAERTQRMRVEQRHADRDRQPADQHHPSGQRVLRHRRLPAPQQHGAERPRDRGGKDEQRAHRRARDVAHVFAEQDRHAQHAEHEADDLAPSTAARAAAPCRTARSRPASCRRGSRERPAGICCTPNRISPFHAAMLNSASASDLAPMLARDRGSNRPTAAPPAASRSPRTAASRRETSAARAR